MAHHFSRKVADDAAWLDHILPGMTAVRDAILRHGRQLRVTGQAPPSVAFAFGRLCHVNTGISTEWGDRRIEGWLNLADDLPNVPVAHQLHGQSGRHAAVLVSGERDISAAAMAHSRKDEPAWILSIRPGKLQRAKYIEEIGGFAKTCARIIDDALASHPVDRIDLYFGGSLAVAWALGQLSNGWPLPRIMQHLDGTNDYRATPLLHVS